MSPIALRVRRHLLTFHKLGNLLTRLQVPGLLAGMKRKNLNWRALLLCWARGEADTMFKQYRAQTDQDVAEAGSAWEGHCLVSRVQSCQSCVVSRTLLDPYHMA